MLNEWSDRAPPEPRPPGRRFWRRMEFWVGVYVALAFAGLVLNLAQFVRGLF